MNGPGKDRTGDEEEQTEMVARREETHWLQRILHFPVAGRNPRGRPRKTWEETITEDRRESTTVEPYSEVHGTMKITLLYHVSHYIRVKKTDI